MCLYIYSRNQHTANKDLVVYKILLRHSFKERISPYMDFKYKLKILYTSPFSIRKSLHSKDLYCINEGLHAFTSIDIAKRTLPYFIKGGIYKCIIPKGSLYYINEEDNEIASNKLIVKRKLWFNRF